MLTRRSPALEVFQFYQLLQRRWQLARTQEAEIKDIEEDDSDTGSFVISEKKINVMTQDLSS